MYDINTKNIRKNFSFWFIFLFIGFVFLFPMLLSLFVNKKESNSFYDTLADVKYVEFETEENALGIPVYYYDVNGIEYKCFVFEEEGRKPSENDVIYYNSYNPSVCMIKNEEESDSSIFIIIILLLLIPVFFITYGGYNIIKIFKRLSEIRYLNKHGKLVKNLPYRLEDSNLTFNNVVIKRLIICYILPNGNTVVLRGDPKFDKKLRDEDRCVDLVIDENNPTKYFIDLEINRKGGNLPQDFCDQEKYKQFFPNYNNTLDHLNSNNNVVNQYNNPYDD